MADQVSTPRGRMRLMCIACRKKEWRPLVECATGDVAPLSSCCGVPTIPMEVRSG